MTVFYKPNGIAAESEEVQRLCGVDPVNSPAHYDFGNFEVIDVLDEWFPSDPHLWQVGKYIARAKHKGNELVDLKKAEYYLRHKIKRLEQEAAR